MYVCMYVCMYDVCGCLECLQHMRSSHTCVERMVTATCDTEDRDKTHGDEDTNSNNNNTNHIQFHVLVRSLFDCACFAIAVYAHISV